MELREIHERYKAQFSSLPTYLKKGIRYIICIFTVIIFLLIISYALQQIPHWQVSHFGITNSKDLAEIENSYRATLAQILGGIAIGIGLYYTWRRVTIAEKELKVSQEGQITERFTRAVDQLGSIDQFGNPAIEIRLGGIYALERIANESEKDYWPIMEILTSYVRKNSPEEIVIVNKKSTSISMDIQGNESTKGKVSKKREMTLDIQAILTVISRRKCYSNKEKSNNLNLKLTYLNSAQLNDTHLEKANFTGCNLCNADFTGAHLEGAILGGADLCLADFTGAHLEGAWFMLAQPRTANFTGAHLEGAWFLAAILKGADFRGANLKGTDFEGASLQGAFGLSVDQLSKVKTLYEAKLDEELETQLREKYPALFEKPK